jgi:hypothetical protein
MPSDWPCRSYWSPNPARRSPRQGRYRRRLGPVFTQPQAVLAPEARGDRLILPQSRKYRRRRSQSPSLRSWPSSPSHRCQKLRSPCQFKPAPTSEVAQSEPPPLPPRKPVANQPPKPIMRRPPRKRLSLCRCQHRPDLLKRRPRGWHIARSGAAIGRGSRDAGSGFRRKLPGPDQRLVRDPRTPSRCPAPARRGGKRRAALPGSTATAAVSRGHDGVPDRDFGDDQV